MDLRFSMHMGNQTEFRNVPIPRSVSSVLGFRSGERDGVLRIFRETGGECVAFCENRARFKRDEDAIRHDEDTPARTLAEEGIAFGNRGRTRKQSRAKPGGCGTGEQ